MITVMCIWINKWLINFCISKTLLINCNDFIYETFWSARTEENSNSLFKALLIIHDVYRNWKFSFFFNFPCSFTLHCYYKWLNSNLCLVFSSAKKLRKWKHIHWSCLSFITFSYCASIRSLNLFEPVCLATTK